MRLSKLLPSFLMLLLSLPAAPQNAASSLAASAPTAVPPLVPYSGAVATLAGRSLPGAESVTFLIYSEETGGDPIFSETQSVAIDATGHFKAQIGATLTNGLPMDLFANGEARWLAVQIAGEPAQSRVLLASVPYALKAADAATLGGLPASAFALAGTKNAASAAVITPDVTATTGAPITTTTGGFAGYLPVFTSPTTISNSTVYQNASGIGINGIPYAALDVTGRTIFRGTMVVSRAGNATSTTGYGSVPLQFFANGWNSTINGPVQPVMQWQAEPTGNNTASPGATLNLLYNNGTVANAVETGLYFNPNGTIHFAAGQTFPGGGGTGTITGVTAGTALTGGGTTGNVTLNLDTTKVPLLSASNTFTGNQGVNGNLGVNGVVNAGTVNATSGFDLSGTPFAFGSQASKSVYLGFAGNSSTTGCCNTADGVNALLVNTTGFDNTGIGSNALVSNTTGTGNTATGAFALQSNTTGNENTASSSGALGSNTTGSENTASGGGSLLQNISGSDNSAFGFIALNNNTTGYSNTASGASALLANTTGFNNTASGVSALYSNITGSSNTADGANALFSNTTGSLNIAIGKDALYPNTTGSDNLAIGEESGQTRDLSNITGSSNTLVGQDTALATGSLANATAIGANVEVTNSNTLVLGCIAGTNGCTNSVSVGIGTTTPDSLLTVNGTADKPGGGSWGTYSDGRLKTVNGSFASGLDQVMQLRPIRYRYKPDNGMGIRDADEHIGVVAQEVQRVIPEAVTENGRGYLLVNNDPIIWSMVNAIKEQQREIEQQQKLLRAQSAAMKSLVAEVRATRKTLREVKAQAAAGQTMMLASK